MKSNAKIHSSLINLEQKKNYDVTMIKGVNWKNGSHPIWKKKMKTAHINKKKQKKNNHFYDRRYYYQLIGNYIRIFQS